MLFHGVTSMMASGDACQSSTWGVAWAYVEEAMKKMHSRRHPMKRRNSMLGLLGELNSGLSSRFLRCDVELDVLT
jgi:hypothetical protein